MDDGGTGPTCPENWYLVAPSQDLPAGGVAAISISATEIVLYRGQSGRVSAFAAHCRHMGCHLGHGKVLGDALQCALHHRVIAPDGIFLDPAGKPRTDQRQPCFPVIERFGAIFIYAGSRPRFDLPSPSVAGDGPVATRCLAPRPFDLKWSTLIANGMDMDHLEAVHGRKLREPAVLEQIDSWQMRLSYRTRVTGKNLSDRLMKHLSGDDIDASITCSGGSMILVQSRIKERRSFIFLSMCPDGGGGTTVRGIAGISGSSKRWQTRLAVRVTAWLFQCFLDKDVGVLDGMRWHEPGNTVTRGDAFSRQLCGYFRSLPDTSPIGSLDADIADVETRQRALI